MQLRRRRVWIDRFQTLLFLRIALYFVIYQAAVWAFYYLERASAQALEAILGASASSFFLFFSAAFLVFIGFLCIYDAIQLAHRIVGPLYRLRKLMQAVTAGEEVEPMKLRKDDFLQDLKDEFNDMLRALEQRGAVVIKAPESEEKANPVPR
jgi:nitrogen fixation/metabolism regulation signal transduction histidine kinase